MPWKGRDGTRPRLFSTFERTDPSPQHHNERVYDFLNRVDRRWHEGVRQTLEEWLEAAPNEFAERVAREFRSTRDRQCLGAFWELYMFVMWTRLRYQTEIEPVISGTPRIADFLIDSTDGRAIVEATVSFEEGADSPASRRQGDAYEALDRTNSPNFFLWIYVEQGEGPMPSLAPVRRELEIWLATLDPDAVAADLDERGRHNNLPELRVHAGSWMLRFEAFPKSPAARGQAGIRPLGVFDTGGARVLNTITRLREALIAKADQTRGADLPVVIALNAHGFFVDDDDIYASLFGDEAIQFHVGSDREVGGRSIRQPTGFWTERRLGRRPHVSAVLTVQNLGPWNVDRIEPVLWLNPWAHRPMLIDLPFRRVEIDLVAGARSETAARNAIADILQLGANWPAPGGPWDDD